MAAIGLAEASRLTGKNQSTIHRAMKAGRLSYTLSASGERQIDVAELQRVFGMNGARAGNAAQPLQSHSTHGGELAALQRLLDTCEATIADLRETIRDQRTRLDAAERREARLTALLTHRRTGSVPNVALRETPWWRRWWR